MCCRTDRSRTAGRIRALLAEPPQLPVKQWCLREPTGLPLHRCLDCFGKGLRTRSGLPLAGCGRPEHCLGFVAGSLYGSFNGLDTFGELVGVLVDGFLHFLDFIVNFVLEGLECLVGCG